MRKTRLLNETTSSVSNSKDSKAGTRRRRSAGVQYNPVSSSYGWDVLMISLGFLVGLGMGYILCFIWRLLRVTQMIIQDPVVLIRYFRHMIEQKLSDIGPV